MATRHRLAGRISFRMAAVFGGAGGLVLLTCSLAPPSGQIAVIGLLVAAVLAFLVDWSSESPPPQGTEADLLTLPLALAKDEDIFGLYRQIGGALREIGQQGDPIYRKLAVQRTGELAHELGQIAARCVVFSGTETWRMVYAHLLNSPGVHLYRSVAGWPRRRLAIGVAQRQEGAQSTFHPLAVWLTHGHNRHVDHPTRPGARACGGSTTARSGPNLRRI